MAKKAYLKPSILLSHIKYWKITDTITEGLVGHHVGTTILMINHDRYWWGTAIDPHTISYQHAS